MNYDKIILGAGLYGLYSALFCGRRGEKVAVFEYDDAPFRRATYINQARVHMGYHYPRSFSTAIKSAGYFRRFNEEYGFCVHRSFDQIYATSAAFSCTDAAQFEKFCRAAGIRCEEVAVSKYFNSGMCDGAVLTEEYTYDAMILKEYFLEELAKHPNVELHFHARIKDICRRETHYEVTLADGGTYEAGFLLNATYASENQILARLGFEPFQIKYELCEIILCEVDEVFKKFGITVMDGPFFSIMPFGKTGFHSLTSVTFTPHETSYDTLPAFECQKGNEAFCSPAQLGNCNECKNHPESAWSYMSNLAKKYLKDEYHFAYQSSLFSMKPILKSSEVDDSRPTVIRKFSEGPTFVSVLSGKINTVYDLDEVLIDG